MKDKRGFTLLEVIVAVSLMGIAVTAILQLLSGSLKTVSVSRDYVDAVNTAETRMRRILASDDIKEGRWSETTHEGYKIDVSIEKLKEQDTENINFDLLDINLDLTWTVAQKSRTYNLRTYKLLKR